MPSLDTAVIVVTTLINSIWLCVVKCHMHCSLQVAAWKRNLLRTVVAMSTSAMAVLLRNVFAYVGALVGEICCLPGQIELSKKGLRELRVHPPAAELRIYLNLCSHRNLLVMEPYQELSWLLLY